MGGSGSRTVQVEGAAVEIAEAGRGAPLLLLHGGHPSLRIGANDAIVELLSAQASVIVPTHPGFGATPAPAHLTTVDDLAYLYLDLMDALNLRDCVVVGLSLGGWIAAEMAVKSTARMSRLVLVDSVGIKPGARDNRDIADIYAVTNKQLDELVYADPKAMARDSKTLPESELVLMARSRESTGRYAWSPFMHNPKLMGRLHRIGIPSLVVWGEADRVVTPDYGRALAAAIPGARFETIAGAGHFPHLEQPVKLAQRIRDFVKEPVS
jgi:pimeloyl-ACP methyl ester carboxylesterase